MSASKRSRGTELLGTTVGEAPAGDRLEDERGARLGRWVVPFQEVQFGREETRAIIRAIRSGTVAGGGPMGQAVERALAKLLGVRHALLTSSCTAAFEAALIALKVQGGEVILPSFGFPSMAAAVVASGAHPVFVDIEPVSLGLDPQRVKDAISTRTRAMVYVEYGGFPGALGDLHEIARQKGIVLIEDAAHSLGSRYRGTPLGAWGTVGCISFHATKIVTCGEGGLFVTDDDRLAEAASVYREYGTNRSAFFRGAVDHYEWVGSGSSGLLAEPLAALLEAQIKRLPTILRRRRIIAHRYLHAFAPLVDAGLLRLPHESSEAAVNWHTFYLLMRDRQLADALIHDLTGRGLDVRRHFHPLHLSEYARRHGYANGEFHVTETVSQCLVRLPIYPALTEQQQTRVIGEVSQCLRAQSSWTTLQ